MKKSFQLEIITPCDAEVKAMDKTNNGFFCHFCTKDVVDLSNKSDYEISKFISENKNQNICARLKNSQLERDFDLLEKSKSNNLKYAVAVAASILLTSNVAAQENSQTNIEQNSSVENIKGKISYKENYSINIKGLVLDSISMLPLSEKIYPNLKLSISNFNKTVDINPKTGEFEMPYTFFKGTKEIIINIKNGSFSFSKKFKINSDIPPNSNYFFEVFLKPEDELKEYKIMGGMGINYIDNKKNKLS